MLAMHLSPLAFPLRSCLLFVTTTADKKLHCDRKKATKKVVQDTMAIYSQTKMVSLISFLFWFFTLFFPQCARTAACFFFLLDVTAGPSATSTTTAKSTTSEKENGGRVEKKKRMADRAGGVVKQGGKKSGQQRTRDAV